LNGRRHLGCALRAQPGRLDELLEPVGLAQRERAGGAGRRWREQPPIAAMITRALAALGRTPGDDRDGRAGARDSAELAHRAAPGSAGELDRVGTAADRGVEARVGERQRLPDRLVELGRVKPVAGDLSSPAEASSRSRCTAGTSQRERVPAPQPASSNATPGPTAIASNTAS